MKKIITTCLVVMFSASMLIAQPKHNMRHDRHQGEKRIVVVDNRRAHDMHTLRIGQIVDRLPRDAKTINTSRGMRFISSNAVFERVHVGHRTAFRVVAFF